MNGTWLYVGVLYAAAVAIARRARVDLPKRVALLFYALVLLFFFRPLTQEYVNVPVDYLETIPPFVTREPQVLNSDMNDEPLQLVPWAQEVRESLRSGRAPLWNAAAGSGYPLLGNGQSSAFAPTRLLALPLPLGEAMTAEAAMKILIALTFTFLYCRGRGWSKLASTFAAVSFGFGGFIPIWVHFPIATSACFFPAVLYLIDRVAERRTFSPFAACAIVGAAIVYGGHPETAAHMLLLAVPYAAWMLFVERTTTWRSIVALGGAMGVAALLSAPQILPLLEAIPRSLRYQTLKTNPGQEHLPYSDWRSAVVQVEPHLWGGVSSRSRWGPSDPDPMSGYAGILGVVSWLGVVVSVVRRRAWRSVEMFFVVASLLVFGAMMGWPPLERGLHFVLPLAANQRIRLLLAMLLAMQCAALIERVEKGERLPLLAGSVATGALVVGLVMATPFPNRDAFQRSLHAALPGAAVVLVAIVASLTVARFRRVALNALLVAVIADVWAATYGWSPPLPKSLMYPTTPLVRELQRLAANAPPSRIAGWYASLVPNLAAMYGLEDIRIHDPMANGDYAAFLDRAAGYDTSQYVPMWNDLDGPILDYLNVRYVIVDDPTVRVDEGRYALRYQGVDGKIFENRRVLPRFFPVRNVLVESRKDVFAREMAEHQDWAHTALLDHLDIENPEMRGDLLRPRPANAPLASSTVVYAPPSDYRIHVDAPRWSLVVSSIPWWPGWKVERNGRPAHPIRVNGHFLGFAVPPGTSVVRVWYSPWTFWVGVWLVLAAMLMLIGMGWRFGRRRKSQPALRVSAATRS